MTDTQANSERGQREFVPVTFLCPVDKARMIGEQAGRSPNGCEGLRAAWSRRPPLRHCEAIRNASSIDRPRFRHCRA
jgi:hypothetical protein